MAACPISQNIKLILSIMYEKDWESLQNWDDHAWKSLLKESYTYTRRRLREAPMDHVEMVAESAFACLVDKVLAKSVNINHAPENLLRGIVRNKCREYLRKNKNFQSLPEDHPPLVEEDFEVDPQTQEQCASACFQKLDLSCRQMLDLSIFQKKTHSEIAQIMNIAEGFVRVKRFRCLQYLRKCLLDTFPDLFH